MAEITEKAYEGIRKHIVDTFTRVILKDDTGTEILNLPIASDDRFTWIHPTKEVQVGWDKLGNKIYDTVPDSQTLQLEIVITGSDPGITLPTTFAQIELHNDMSDVMSVESFEPFTMSNEEDQITIVHNIEVPQVTV